MNKPLNASKELPAGPFCALNTAGPGNRREPGLVASTQIRNNRADIAPECSSGSGIDLGEVSSRYASANQLCASPAAP